MTSLLCYTCLKNATLFSIRLKVNLCLLYANVWIISMANFSASCALYSKGRCANPGLCSELIILTLTEKELKG